MSRISVRLCFFALAALALLASAHVGAQEAPKPAPKQPEKEAPAKDAADVVIPFEFDGLMFVQTKINGKGPYKFLFDSGATMCVLNRRLAKELGLKERDSMGGIQGVGEAEAKMVVLDSIDVGGFTKGKSVAATIDLDHISGSAGFHFMGIVGQNVIRLMKEIEIDFSAQRITVTKYGPKEMPRDMDEMMVRLLETDLEDLPGLPGPEKEEPKKGPKDQPRKEEDFSAGPAYGHWLWQDAAEPEGAAPTPLAPPAMKLSYATLSLPLVGELVPLWTVTCSINGTESRFMFDTGASSLLVIGNDFAKDLNLDTSFTFPVKGIGTGSASAGIADSFTVGDFKATDIAGMTTALPKMSDGLLNTETPFIKQFLDMLPEAFRAMIEQQIKKLAKTIDFQGIIGLPLALKYKKLVVNTKAKTLEFVPYGKDEVNKLDPAEGEEFVKDAVIRTWNGKASATGITGDCVPLDDWKKLGVETGGLLVESVKEGSGAAKAGIKKGDIITHLVGETDVPDMEDAKKSKGNLEIRDSTSLILWACSKDPGSDVVVRVKRGEKSEDVKMKLDALGWTGKFPERFKAK